jgi:pimeloyl-ACP methyl ester carboxylesterase
MEPPLSGRDTMEESQTMQDRSLDLVRLEHRLPPAADSGVSLALFEVAPTNAAPTKTPVLLLHGATFGAPMFDLPLPGYSMQAFLAMRGWRTYALDVRGYGRSVPSAVLDAPPQANEPYARFDEAVEDLAAGIAFVRSRTGCSRVNLVGFSWGTVVAGAFAATSDSLLERVVLYAPIYAEINEAWIDRIADPADRARVNPALGSYRWVDLAQLLSRWDADIPPGAAKADYRDDAIPETIMQVLAATDPASGFRGDASFRAPNGALVDVFEAFNGRPLYDPERISVPTLIIRGSDDATSTATDALRLFDRLGARSKRFVTISPGSHFLCVERNAAEFYAEIELYLAFCQQV